jgi:hypothetical protein
MAEVADKPVYKTRAEIKSRVAHINAEMAKLDSRLNKLYGDNRSEYAQGIMDKIFQEFNKGKRWLDKMRSNVAEHLHSYSPNGRVRHLYGYLNTDRECQGTQERRGINAPIQGFASEVGVKADRMIVESYYRELPRLKKWLGLKESTWQKFRLKCSRAVHDALYKQIPYTFVIPFIHILQYQATYGVAQAYEKAFGIRFTVEPEIEIGIGASADNESDWDWSLCDLVRILVKTVEDIERIGQLEGTKQEVLEQIFKPWRNKKVRNYLQSKYPILGVADLDDQIEIALKHLDKLLSEMK